MGESSRTQRGQARHHQKPRNDHSGLACAVRNPVAEAATERRWVERLYGRRFEDDWRLIRATFRPQRLTGPDSGSYMGSAAAMCVDR